MEAVEASDLHKCAGLILPPQTEGNGVTLVSGFVPQNLN